MIKVTRLNAVTSWSRALNAARRTVGKSALKKEPSDSWKAKMLLAEHSPIRLVEYEWTWVVPYLHYQTPLILLNIK